MRLADRLHADTLFRSTIARYAFSVAAVAVAFVLKTLLTPLTGPGAPFVLFYTATLVTSLVAGAGPAILSIAISLPLAGSLFVLHSGRPALQAAFLALLFGVNGLIVVYLTVVTSRRRRSQLEANQQLQSANEERARSLARLRETIELAPDAYFLADLDFRLTDVNQAACQHLGYERSELLGKTIFDILATEDHERLKAVKAELLVPGRVSKSEATQKRKDGTLVPVEVSSNILPGGRWQAFVRDISEARRIADEREQLLAREQFARQQAESANEQLRESEERFRLTIEEAPIGMALIALDGRFVRVNRALCEITGYRSDELTQLTFQRITHPDDLDIDVNARDRLERGEIARHQLEKRYIRKNGSVVDVMLSVSVLRGPDGGARYFISQMEDITARKRAEQGLQRAVAARDDVLGIVAHDLRNPLNTILMQASLLERPEPEPERRDQTPRLVLTRSAKRMNHLIQDLLDVAAIEAGQLKVERERLSTPDLARDALEAQRPLATSAGLELRLEVEPRVGDVWGDHNRLLQVFENLIGNAMKFTTEGGRITVCATAKDNEVVFAVADTGAGIAPEKVPHVFERFWQAATRESRLGAGLGLPITRGIVEAHGGRIWVESTVGRGSTFFFTIPAAAATSAQSTDATHSSKPAWRSNVRKRRQRS